MKGPYSDKLFDYYEICGGPQALWLAKVLVHDNPPGSGNDTGRANAELFAAAPELLAECKRLREENERLNSVLCTTGDEDTAYPLWSCIEQLDAFFKDYDGDGWETLERCYRSLVTIAAARALLGGSE